MEQARYALICQSEGIVPIVEPDLVLAGTHTLEDAVEVRLPPHPTPWLGLGLGCGGQATPIPTPHTPHPTPHSLGSDAVEITLHPAAPAPHTPDPSPDPKPHTDPAHTQLTP